MLLVFFSLSRIICSLNFFFCLLHLVFYLKAFANFVYTTCIFSTFPQIIFKNYFFGYYRFSLNI
uniref:Uncharacterized protein n=1 Tax=Octopus bimaculoides TaxID=37653 RepID=A0A0L8H0B2_OCTBM